MGLYNIIHGSNKYSEIILQVLNLELDEVARFRDAWIEDDKIIIYNRCGAGNKNDRKLNKTGCPEYWNQIRDHSLYIKDYEDDFDSTYTYTEFKIPEEYKNVIEKIKKLQDRNGSHIPASEEDIKNKVEQIMEENPEQLEPITNILKNINDK